jgi:alpha-tubulin suppressor-like RCC1 family protein
MRQFLVLLLALLAAHCTDPQPVKLFPCENETCSGHGVCQVTAEGHAVCQCDEAYAAVGLTCLANCFDVDCSDRGGCVVLDNELLCVCDQGYWAAGLECRPDPPGLCDGQDCTGHGVCVEQEGEAGCICEFGWMPFGLTCVPSACNGVGCSGHGACVERKGLAHCQCDPTYETQGLGCVPSACSLTDCNGHGACVDQGGQSTCVCDHGYVAAGLECRPAPCTAVDCNGHGVCVEGEERLACQCDIGWVADGLSCRPGCIERDCNNHGACIQAEEGLRCVCDPGYEEDGQGCVALGPPAEAPWLRLALGDRHSCGLLASGHVQCWGDDSAGQVSDSPTFFLSELAAGGSHNCGLRADDGETWCWGEAADGRTAAPLGVLFRELAAGRRHTCGLRDSDGGVECWGANDHGQLQAPVGLEAQAITAGARHSCALGASDGEAVCWGDNQAGQASPPRDVAFRALSAGDEHTCGIRAGDGLVECWGSDQAGQLRAPEDLLFRVLASGARHTCGLREGNGRVECWGDNSAGQASPPPYAVFRELAAGGQHSCGVRETTGQTECWGRDVEGQGCSVDGDTDTTADCRDACNNDPDKVDPGLCGCGIADTDSDDNGTPDCLEPPITGPTITLSCFADAFTETGYFCTPEGTPVADGDVLTWSLAAGGSCSWLNQDADGTLRGFPSASNIGVCNETIVLSDNRDGSTEHPFSLEVKPLPGLLSVADDSVCFLASSGVVRCWGSGVQGRLGHDDELDVGAGLPGRTIIDMGDVPVGGNVTFLGTSYAQQCAVLEGGSVRCWGLNHIGQLGYPHRNDVGAGGPGGSIISNGDLPFGGVAVQAVPSAGGVCVLLDTGGVRCWGTAFYGNFYDNSGTLTAAQAAVLGDVAGLSSIKSIDAGSTHYCAVGWGGALRCWGPNGALGYDDYDDVGYWDSPSLDEKGDVPVGGPVAQVDVGEWNTCAVLENGGLRCWGGNSVGQLGYNDTEWVADGTPGRSILDMGDVPVGARVIQASIGLGAACAVLETRAVRCWGGNWEGQLGYNHTTYIADGVGPTIIEAGDVPLGGRALQVQVDDWDGDITCALMESGAVRCWGLWIGHGQGHSNNIGDGGPGGTIIENGDVPIF